MKDYQTVCADLMMMLKDVEESLEDIVATARLLENQTAEPHVKADNFLPDFPLAGD